MEITIALFLSVSPDINNKLQNEGTIIVKTFLAIVLTSSPHQKYAYSTTRKEEHSIKAASRQLYNYNQAVITCSK